MFADKNMPTLTIWNIRYSERKIILQLLVFDIATQNCFTDKHLQVGQFTELLVIPVKEVITSKPLPVRCFAGITGQIKSKLPTQRAFVPHVFSCMRCKPYNSPKWKKCLAFRLFWCLSVCEKATLSSASQSMNPISTTRSQSCSVVERESNTLSKVDVQSANLQEDVQSIKRAQ